jgi:hypothetical protein
MTRAVSAAPHNILCSGSQAATSRKKSKKIAPKFNKMLAFFGV